MKLLTIEEIIQALQKDGISITRKKFNYYHKIGLLFAPETRIKKRVREGVKSFYAKELLERLKKIYELKDSQYTLEEIKDCLHERDKTAVTQLYRNEAGFPITEAKAMHIAFRWRKEGYYKGLLLIFWDIMDRLMISMEGHTEEAHILDSIRDKVIRRIHAPKHKTIIGKVFEDETSLLRTKIRSKDRLLSKLNGKQEVLTKFLRHYLAVPTPERPPDEEKMEMVERHLECLTQKDLEKLKKKYEKEGFL